MACRPSPTSVPTIAFLGHPAARARETTLCDCLSTSCTCNRTHSTWLLSQVLALEAQVQEAARLQRETEARSRQVQDSSSALEVELCALRAECVRHEEGVRVQSGRAEAAEREKAAAERDWAARLEHEVQAKEQEMQVRGQEVRGQEVRP